MRFLSIKKKTRGLSSKVKRIEKWKTENITLDLDLLTKQNKLYVKLWIPPFYNLYTISKNKVGHKNPPNWFNKIILEAMIDVYKSWEEKLKELGKPYYLKIWLYDPDFINSQIVVALDYNIDYYNSLFEKDERKKKFSENKYKLDNIQIGDFNWQCHKDQYIVFESEHIYDKEYLKYVRKRAYKIEEMQISGQKETCYYIREGNVWIGSLE